MTFDFQPHLQSELIVLRPLKEEDREGLFAVASDPLLWKLHPQRDRYQRPVFDTFFDAAMKSGCALLAQDAKTGETLGSSRYYDWDPAGKSIAVGYSFLSRACWGRGYNREMKKLMLDHAFHFADTAIFHVGKYNLRSRRAMEKIGGEFVEEVERTLPDGTPNPSVIYQIRRQNNI